MGIATHLGIKLKEYDARIRSFIPDYEEMLDVAAGAIPASARTIVDLGIGTGALAWRCAKGAQWARITGIDADCEILKMAQQRLGSRVTLLCQSLLRARIPRCDAVVASLALHHVRTQKAKSRLYARIHTALRSRGLFVTVDCHPASDSCLAYQQRQTWIGHLLHSYSRSEALRLLASWSHEDVYTPLETEVKSIQQSGFRVHVRWRQGAFAVIMGKRH
jgi:ubiquinone/menaquinone biosynthesis C-methylase UbiE